MPGLQAKQFGVLAAVDSKTNKVAWKKEIPMPKNLRVAAMATAGGLMFHQTGDGVLEGLDAKTGKVVWEFQTGFAGVGSAPISYELDKDLKPVSRRFLGDPEAIKAAAEAVARQTEAKK